MHVNIVGRGVEREWIEKTTVLRKSRNHERVVRDVTAILSQWCSKVMISIDLSNPKFKQDESGEESFRGEYMEAGL